MSLVANVATAQGIANSADATQASLIQAGRYLATAADCAACHTAQGGKPFAGGYPVISPLGTIYSTNITPSLSSGIGAYSEQDFARAVRAGVRRDGAHLYPAMPYTDYAGLTDQDIHALYAYFHHGIAAVDAPARQTALTFPFDIRASMAIWNGLYAKNTPFVPDPAKSPSVNRGAYLVNSLGHCAACHTPRDALMGQHGGDALAGGSLGSWYAPNISSDPVSGIGGWSDHDLSQYLRTGFVAGKAQANGPMAEAIDHSLQYLSDSDIAAIVAYLKQTQPMPTRESKARSDYGHALSEGALRGNAVTTPHGWAIFSGSCAACHRANGAGPANGDYPSLYHNTATGADNADNLIATILFGLRRDAAGKPAFMPAFGPTASFADHLSDQDVADVTNYVLTQFGNPNVKVTAAHVATVRQGGKPPLLAKLGSVTVSGVVVLLLVIGAVVLLRRRRRVLHASRPPL